MYFYYWWLIRIPVLFLSLFFIYDLEIFCLLNSFLILHLTLGLTSILSDYLYKKSLKTFLIVSVRLLSLELLRYTLEFIL